MTQIKLLDLSDVLIEEIALQSPQLKQVCDVNIVDIREYGYEFPEMGDETMIVRINEREYTVKKDYLNKYEEFIQKKECKELNPGIYIDKIFECYCKIIENPQLFCKAIEKSEFKFAYEQHTYGNKVFALMDIKNSIVATILFSLYH